MKMVMNQMTCKKCKHSWPNKKPDWFNQSCPQCKARMDEGLFQNETDPHKDGFDAAYAAYVAEKMNGDLD